VLDVREPGVDSKAFRPTLDDIRVDRSTQTATSADQVMAVTRHRTLAVKPSADLIPYDVDQLGMLEIMQRAIHRGQTDGRPTGTQQRMQFARGDELPAIPQRLEDRNTLPRPPPTKIRRTQPAATFRPQLTHHLPADRPLAQAK
jgi:hypothetical protein